MHEAGQEMLGMGEYPAIYRISVSAVSRSDLSGWAVVVMLAIRLCESAVAFGNIGGNGQGRSIQLVCKKVVSPWETPGQTCNLIGEVYGFLVDIKVLEHERHFTVLFRIA